MCGTTSQIARASQCRDLTVSLNVRPSSGPAAGDGVALFILPVAASGYWFSVDPRLSMRCFVYVHCVSLRICLAACVASHSVLWVVCACLFSGSIVSETFGSKLQRPRTNVLFLLSYLSAPCLRSTSPGQFSCGLPFLCVHVSC